MRAWDSARITIGAAFVGAVVIGLVVLLVATNRPTPPPLEVRTREPMPTPTSTIYVHVDGAVNEAGIYLLPLGSRVFEAIDAAGGARESAELRELNLAARVTDGQKLVIPERPPPREPADESIAIAVAPMPTRPVSTTGNSPALININTATQRILESLPGIGPVTATRIITYRESNGPFTRIEQVRDARLVNAPTYERIRTLISVE